VEAGLVGEVAQPAVPQVAGDDEMLDAIGAFQIHLLRQDGQRLQVVARAARRVAGRGARQRRREQQPGNEQDGATGSAHGRVSCGGTFPT
jgi:hypothetical protein